MKKKTLRSIIRAEIVNEIELKPDNTSQIYNRIEQLLDMTGWIGDSYFERSFPDPDTSIKTIKYLDAALKIIEKVAKDIDKAPRKDTPVSAGTDQ